MKVTKERLVESKEKLKLLLFLVENGVDRRKAIREYNEAKKIYNDLVYVYNLKIGGKKWKLKKVI